MLAYVARRLVLSLFMVLGISFVSFWVVSHINPLYGLLFQSPRPTERIDRLTRLNHLDDALPVRYLHWLSDLVAGPGFGKTVVDGQPVGPPVWQALQHSLELAVASIVVIVVLSVLVGTVAARLRGSALDFAVRGFAYFSWSLPPFIVALALLLAVSRFDASTGRQPFYPSGPPQGSPLEWVRHLALPVATVSVAFVGHYARFVRSSLLVTLDATYTNAARAKGLSELQLTLRHALRNALIPFVAVLSLEFGSLVGATFVADAVFHLDGLGGLFLQSITLADPFFTQSILVTTAMTTIVLSLLADLCTGWLDPRVRLR
jgi:peptide/nickel transport system permease protein